MNLYVFYHFYLNKVCLFHAMDSATRYLDCSIVQNTSLELAVLAFDSCWLGKFWPPAATLGDSAFNKLEFTGNLLSLNISFRPVSPLRHSKNVLESKHAVIRSILLFLVDDSSSNTCLAVMQYVRISNALYGSELVPAHEMARRCSKPIGPRINPLPVTQDVIDAQLQLEPSEI